MDLYEFNGIHKREFRSVTKRDVEIDDRPMKIGREKSDARLVFEATKRSSE